MEHDDTAHTNYFNPKIRLFIKYMCLSVNNIQLIIFINYLASPKPYLHNVFSVACIVLILVISKLQIVTISFNKFTFLIHVHAGKLTLCLLVTSADKLDKQFGPRSGPTNRRA